ncbi:MAG: nitroreductase family protein [Planctomycetota bacterium]
MSTPPNSRFVPLAFRRQGEDEMRARAIALRDELARRRSVRDFRPDAIPRDVIDACIATAGSAPSGANRQPWTFVVVTAPDVKRAIRVAAEEEEQKNYDGRMGDEWLAALAPLGTTWEKPFLEIAPALIVVFRHVYGVGVPPERRQSASEPDSELHYKNYYTQESVGIACGFLLAALHHAGLASLTHTPSPMGFLQKLLGRPENERAYLLIPVGYPAEDCTVPDIARKTLEEIRRDA